MTLPGNKEKILETAMLAALNRKRYTQDLLSKDCQSELYKQAHKSACLDCVSACKALFSFYTRKNAIASSEEKKQNG